VTLALGPHARQDHRVGASNGGAAVVLRGRLLPFSILVAVADASSGASLPAATTSTQPSTGDSSCVAALDSLRAVFQRDYPGYRDKVAGREVALAALTDSIRAIARTSDHYETCIPALRRWARFFRDPHVTGPWQSSPPAAGEPSASAATPLGPPPDDPARPSLRFLDDSTALVRLPSFDSTYKPVIDSLLGASSRRLRTTPYLSWT